MIRASKPGIFLLALSLMAASHVSAHPHVFISNRLNLVFEGPVLSRIDVQWTFDELYSSMILEDFDKGKKGTFDEADTKALKKGGFDNLENYHYFLALEVDGKAIPLPAVQGFRPSIEGAALVYRFSLPVKLRLKGGVKTTFGITVYDDTYYVAFDKMTPADVTIESASPVDHAVSIGKAKLKATWPGQWMPDEVILRVKGP